MNFEIKFALSIDGIPLGSPRAEVRQHLQNKYSADFEDMNADVPIGYWGEINRDYYENLDIFTLYDANDKFIGIEFWGGPEDRAAIPVIEGNKLFGRTEADVLSILENLSIYYQPNEALMTNYISYSHGLILDFEVENNFYRGHLSLEERAEGRLGRLYVINDPHYLKVYAGIS